eukprot:PhM_4_TR3018/c5_g1_i1/m.89546
MLITPGLESRLFSNVLECSSQRAMRCDHMSVASTESESQRRSSSMNSERAAVLRPVRTLLGLCPKKHYNSVVSMVAEGCGAKSSLSIGRKLVLVLASIADILKQEAAVSPHGAQHSDGVSHQLIDTPSLPPDSPTQYEGVVPYSDTPPLGAVQ